jgi:hypothetical protein
MRVAIVGNELVVGFAGHLQIVTTRNYNIIANSHTLQITRALAKYSQSFTSRSLVKDFNNRNHSDPMLTSLPAG